MNDIESHNAVRPDICQPCVHSSELCEIDGEGEQTREEREREREGAGERRRTRSRDRGKGRGGDGATVRGGPEGVLVAYRAAADAALLTRELGAPSGGGFQLKADVFFTKLGFTTTFTQTPYTT